MRAIDADALQLAIVEEGQANKRKKYIIGDIWELTGAEIRDVINSQPTIQSEPHWIPVTERLPKPRESVIISVNGKYGDWIGEGCYWETTENHVIWKGYRWNATYWDDEIIAWMPLPEPYKGVTE